VLLGYAHKFGYQRKRLARYFSRSAYYFDASASLLPELKRRDGCSGMECRQGGLAGIDLVGRDHDLTRTRD
jgi:hypothetical protein